MVKWSEFIENYLILRENMDCMNKPNIESQMKCILKTNKTPTKKKKKAKRR